MADDAREAFPCWDEPNFKIPYQLTLEVPAAHEAVSNTPVEKTETKDGKEVKMPATPEIAGEQLDGLVQFVRKLAVKK